MRTFETFKFCRKNHPFCNSLMNGNYADKMTLFLIVFNVSFRLYCVLISSRDGCCALILNNRDNAIVGLPELADPHPADH